MQALSSWGFHRKVQIEGIVAPKQLVRRWSESATDAFRATRLESLFVPFWDCIVSRAAPRRRHAATAAWLNSAHGELRLYGLGTPSSKAALARQAATEFWCTLMADAVSLTEVPVSSSEEISRKQPDRLIAGPLGLTLRPNLTTSNGAIR